MVFDNVDLMAVFDKDGTMIAAAPLRRPLSITVTDKGRAKHIWTEHTANRVYAAWDGRSVSIYRNTNFDVAYYGLTVDDSLGMYRSGHVRIDIHKQEATNGCIFIVDDGTPAYDSRNLTPLNLFEPALIQSVQKAIGHKNASREMASSGSTNSTMFMTPISEWVPSKLEKPIAKPASRKKA